MESVGPERIGEVLSPYLRSPEDRDRLFPQNRKVEIVFLVEAVNKILPRTEGVEDITLVELPGVGIEVPTILPEKFQAIARRRMLAQLRWYRDTLPEPGARHPLAGYLEQLACVGRVVTKGKGKSRGYLNAGYVKALAFKDDPAKWNCYIQSPKSEGSTDEGMDGFCPACMLFGTLLDSSKIYIGSPSKNAFGESVGVKSRVEFDPAFAVTDRSQTVMPLTHNKVAEGLSWTGQGLYTEQHVTAGTVFVGRVVLEDVTETELKNFLAVLSALDRLGGRERIYGTVRVHLVAVRGGKYEETSALELARALARDYKDRIPPVEEAREKLLKLLEGRGFYEIRSSEFKRLLEEWDEWDRLWRETVELDKQVIERAVALSQGEGKFMPGC